MRKHKLLISALCVCMAMVQMPMSIFAAEADEALEEIICEGVTDDADQGFTFTDDLDVTAAPGSFEGGSGTASDPYRIASYDQLLLIGSQTEEGLYYMLVSDISANDAEPGDSSPNVWTPVDPKGCHFDGNGKTISNLCIGTETISAEEDGKTTDKIYAALFGAKGTAEEIKNVTVRNVHFKGADQYAASLAIKVKDMSGCRLTGTLTMSDDTQNGYCLGGLAYEASGKVTECTYDAGIELAIGKYIGGIVYAASDIENCTSTETAFIKLDCEWHNYTFYTLPNGGIGGIAYKAGTEAAQGILKNNVGNAVLDGTGNSHPHDAAGICVNAVNCDVSGNINHGSIKGNYATGIVYTMNGGSIKDCENNGKIEGYSVGAGIVGAANNVDEISGCKNSGNIIETNKIQSGFDMGFGGAAGIIGESSSAKTISNCVNTGRIDSEVAAAGIIGVYAYHENSLMENCANTGDITGSEAGGIAFFAEGSIYHDSDGNKTGPGRAKIRNTYNAGKVRMSDSDGEYGWGFGGLVGYATYADIENCFNAGMVDQSNIVNKQSNNLTTGGIAGIIRNTTIKNSYNTGAIKGGTTYAIVAKDTFEAGTCTLTDCYFLDGCAQKPAGDKDGKSVSGLSATKLKGTSMAKAESYKNWNYDSIWQLDKNENYPYPELKDNPYIGPKVEIDENAGTDDPKPSPDPDKPVDTVTGGTYVVNQKFDVTGFLIQSYAKYDVVPKGAAIVKNGLVTVKKVPADGKITIYGYVKNGSKWIKDKAFEFTAEKPGLPKTVTFTVPYDEAINPDDANARALVTDLVKNTTLVPTAWISSKPAIADYDADKGIIYAKSKGSTKITAIFGDPASTDCAKYTFTVKVNVPKISKTALNMQSGVTQTLKISGAARTAKITWSSSSPEYVSVDADTGKVKALKYNAETGGRATIKAAIDGVEFPAYACEVTVPSPKLKVTDFTLAVKKSVKIAVQNTRLKTKDGGITFESSDKTIADVDANGKITAIAPGECTITVKTAGVELTCFVEVR